MKAKIKPWGKELIAFQNSDVAIWHLFIEPWQETSLHSHPKKKTGLIVLSGGAEVSFLSGSHKLFAGEKTMIRSGVFHRTRNMTNQTLQLFEVETPVDKSDIIRIKDKYGRDVYNPNEDEVDVYQKYIWDNNERRKYRTSKIGDCSVKLGVFRNHSRICFDGESVFLADRIHPERIYIFLSGGLKSKDTMVCSPGDVVYGESLITLNSEFKLIENSEYISISNEYIKNNDISGQVPIF